MPTHGVLTALQGPAWTLPLLPPYGFCCSSSSWGAPHSRSAALPDPHPHPHPHAPTPPPPPPAPPAKLPCSTAGTALGYASCLLYLLSRLSQLWKNHVRGSAEGLAISMFMCAIAANSLYGASILVRSTSWAELRSSLPWLVGSLGTVALDLGIALQSRVLGAAPKHHPSDEDEPLLQP